MKKIININIALTISLLISGFISNYYISNIFDESARKTILFSSNITLLFSSLFVIILYLILFWFLWNLIKSIKIKINHQEFYNIVFVVYSFFAVIEISKIIVTYIYLKNEVVNLRPDQHIQLSIIKTNWFQLIEIINFLEVFFLPMILFIGLKEKKVSFKYSFIVSSIFMFTIFLLSL